MHVKYNQPSALITAIVGEALLDGYDALGRDDIETSIHRAKDFVLQNEVTSGYFKKSSIYVADHLNVDATCGAFLAKYGRVFSDDECLEAAERTARHICEYQFSDGAFPYTNEVKGNYQYSMQIPCIHYQGVTIYYLLKINDVLGMDWIDPYLKNGLKWLASVQNTYGRFDWSKSGLMFAYYLSGAYAFAIPSFMYGCKWDAGYKDNAYRAMDVLEANVDGVANRWERASLLSLPFSVISTLRTAGIGNYPLKHWMYRFGYGMYRQAARRRFGETVNPRVFNSLSSILGINASTIEPDNNFPDLFMTSEILDCLSYSLSKYTDKMEIIL
ncbi:MAG: hypothetical protein E4G94_02010 [ANME-2 cluster archaeon]|nr:MAG: hypothetical protein E4G94_02010 [ANME-2 cluster archaeon]